MAVTPLIERKFRVVSDAWRAHATTRQSLRQGYLARTAHLNVHVRIAGGEAWLTLKSQQAGASRREFVYAIAPADAEGLIAHRIGQVIEKVRHTIPFANRIWAVIEFEGALAGLMLAEYELEGGPAPLQMPDWVGEEVTDDPFYRNSAL